MLEKFKNVAVIGAGTMGMGIAEVAATAGHNVKVYDLNSDFAEKSKQKMMDRLNSRVQRGKISEELSQLISNHVSIVKTLSELSDSHLVIEAIVENLEIKQNLFKELQEICNVNTFYTTNTSSISVTAIASVLNQPENMIGLHFFNPAPVMQLVEVIAGLKSSQENLEDGLELCRSWKKMPVLAKSTPGFIVNRVARPFYGEALKMLQEQVSNHATIDCVMKSAGFRMGPFELMDLIGIDVNLSVSKTVYQEMFYDPRYKPSLIQQEMVYAGMLGRKSGLGFYDYQNSELSDCIGYENLYKLDEEISNPFEKLNEHYEIEIEGCLVALSNGQTCSQRQEAKPIAQFDLCLNYEKAGILTIAFAPNFPQDTKQKIVALIQNAGKQVVVIDDNPALIAMRTVCMLINEAADAIENGVCSREDVDLAMQKGVNYPIGLIDWAERIGISKVVETLDNLYQWFGDDRYRASAWLRKQIL